MLCRAWSPVDWTASDDRVRGGKSQSFFECNAFEPIARFHGELDVKTLGGAGFASQRTAGENRSWDLSDYKGIQIEIGKSDSKRYTLILKDELLPKNPENGREQSTVSYEYDFRPQSKSSSGDSKKTIFVPFTALKPTYRGREKKDAAPVNLKSVKRLSIMMRSFFGDQEGSFSLSIRSISAVKELPQEKFEDLSSHSPDLEAEKLRRDDEKDRPISKRLHASRRYFAFLLVAAGGLFYTIYRAYPMIISRL
ncbi:CIA30-domain-containing protein [Viridothelium virens]|uniref:CIA30-domain-containing protein n=1 Tax=Viridothelium virens TaxID=1048519 RepID=A0A6A6HJQ1_VIRVR|nr:CIA30-domain-containing protein [Viridothelium virens]